MRYIYIVLILILQIDLNAIETVNIPDSFEKLTDVVNENAQKFEIKEAYVKEDNTVIYYRSGIKKTILNKGDKVLLIKDNISFFRIQQPVEGYIKKEDVTFQPIKLKKIKTSKRKKSQIKPLKEKNIKKSKNVVHMKSFKKGNKVKKTKKNYKEKLAYQNYTFSKVPKMNFALLGLYSFHYNSPGIELRTKLEIEGFSLPFEWQYIFGDSLRVRFWPKYYFNSDKKQESFIFFSLYSAVTLKRSSVGTSHAENGLGGGFLKKFMELSLWLTTDLEYSGDIPLRNFLSFRNRLEFFLDPAYILIANRFSSGVIRNSDNKEPIINFATEIEFGIETWRDIIFLIGIEVKSDNLNDLIFDQKSVAVFGDSLQFLIKSGFLFYF